ncbi:SCO family protein [Marinobacter xestospongiae]|uniref:SCO family protein n=1 Tax=Marinobacter xestospongiae TaxID=994319 RepID=A0ABU3VZ62_9GAMM|nr:SCO family protein [Marinobacter xestospongiae]MDV2079582.1 SCO family protein [Marinobacter xestospongiae]
MDRTVRNTVIILVMVVVLVFGLVVGRQVFQAETANTAPAPELSELNTFVYEQGRTLPSFQLLNEAGETVSQEALKGRWTFAFVGYTFCPDVCPATLSTLRQADGLMPDTLPQPDYLLISADPERDTPARLTEYLNFFGDDFHGLTGDLSVLRDLAKSLNAVFVHREDKGVQLVDHSAHIALINPEGEMTAVIQPPHTPKDLAEAYQKIYEWTRRNHPRAG